MIASLAMLAAFGAMLGYCVLEAAREARLRWRVEDRIARIGYDQAHGVVERLSIQDVQERQLEEQARRSRNIRTRPSARLESVAGSGGPAVLR